MKGNKEKGEKMSENIRKETAHERLLTEEQTKGWGRGGERGVVVTGWWALRGALDGMSTGCYSICWQIEHQ